MRLFSILLALVLATGEPASRTLFRVTPRNYTGLTNMNSGDPAGVVFFGLFELALPIICAANPKQVNCQNTPILQIPNFNMYSKLTVEIDDRMGNYSLCNPDPNTGIFSCNGSWFSTREEGRCKGSQELGKDCY